MPKDFSILIVDHSPMLKRLMRQSLQEKKNLHLIEAQDGKDALDKLMEHRIDLIVSGINMPKVNGLELLKALKNHSALKSIPFVVLTSETEDDMFKQCMASGADDFIKKPFTGDDLIIKIQSILGWLEKQ